MTARTSRKTVTFAHPFRLEGSDGTWPAGIYDIETDEEDLDSLTIAGRRRLRTIIYRRDEVRGTSEAVPVDPDSLDAALRADTARAESGTSAPVAGGMPPARPAPPPAAPEPRFTPLWVVPLALGLLILAAAFYGPFPAPGSPPDPAPALIRP